MSPRTTDRKRHPVTIKHVESADKRTERQKLWDVYKYVLENWACYASEVADKTKLDVKEVNRLCRKLASRGLFAGEHVNSERTITWQTYYDVLNETGARAAAKKDFDNRIPAEAAKVEPKATKKPVTKTNRRGATGARYTVEQIEAAVKARGEGQNWKQVAATVGVKAPQHFSKIVRALRPEVA